MAIMQTAMMALTTMTLTMIATVLTIMTMIKSTGNLFRPEHLTALIIKSY